MSSMTFNDNVYPAISVRQISSGTELYNALLSFAEDNSSPSEFAIKSAISEIESVRNFFSNEALSPATSGFMDQCIKLYSATYIPALSVAWTVNSLAKKLSSVPLTWITKGFKRPIFGGPCAYADLLSALYNMGAYEATRGIQAVTMQIGVGSAADHTEQCANRRSHFMRAGYYYRHAMKVVKSMSPATRKLLPAEYSEDYFSVFENYCIGMGFEAVFRAKVSDGLKSLTRSGNQAMFATMSSLARATVHYYKVAEHLLDSNKEVRKAIDPKIVATILYKRQYYYAFAYFYVGVCMRADAQYKEALDAFVEAESTAIAARKELEKAPHGEFYKQCGMKPAIETLLTEVRKFLDIISSACRDMTPAPPELLIDMPPDKRKVVLETYTKVGRDLPKIENTELSTIFRSIASEDLPSDAEATYKQLEEYLKELIAAAKQACPAVSEKNLNLGKSCTTLCATETNQAVHKYFLLLYNIFANYVPLELERMELNVGEVHHASPEVAKASARLSALKKDLGDFKKVYADFCALISSTGAFPASYQQLKAAIQNTETLKAADQERIKTYGAKYWGSEEFCDAIGAFLRTCKEAEASFKDAGMFCAKIKESVTAEGLDNIDNKVSCITDYEKRIHEIATIMRDSNVEEDQSIDYDALSGVRTTTDLPALLELYRKGQMHPKFVTYAYSLAAQSYTLLLNNYECSLADLGEDIAGLYTKAETKNSKMALAKAQERVRASYKTVVESASQMLTVMEQFLNNIGVQQCIISENPSALGVSHRAAKCPTNLYEEMELFVCKTAELIQSTTFNINTVKTSIDECVAKSKSLLDASLARTKQYNDEVREKSSKIKLREPIKIDTR